MGPLVVYAVRRWPKRRYAAHDCIMFSPTFVQSHDFGMIHADRETSPLCVHFICMHKNLTVSNTRVGSGGFSAWLATKQVVRFFPEHDTSQAVIQKAMTSGHIYLEGSGKENKQQDRLLSGGVTYHGWKIGFVVPKNRLCWSSLLNHNDMKPSPDTMRYVNVLLYCLIPQQVML